MSYSFSAKVLLRFRDICNFNLCKNPLGFFLVAYLFCIRYFSKTKSNPAKKLQGNVFQLKWRPHAKIQLIWSKKQKQPKSSLVPFFHSYINRSSYCVIVQVRVVLKRTVVGEWRFDNLSWSHLSHLFWVKWIVFVSRWCCKSGLLKAIGQLSHDGIG